MTAVKENFAELREDGARLKDAWGVRVLGALVIVGATALAYVPAVAGKFVWDDSSWTTGIRPLLRDGSGLRRMWFDPAALQQYYPLSGTTFWIDYHLWGFNPVPYHIENLLLHVVSALLFWALLRRLNVPGAWLAGAIFAVHPLMVESVAWITERKNVLSLPFYLGSILAYDRFTRLGDAAGDAPAGLGRNWGAYVGAFVLFAAALLAKATAFSM